MVEVVRDLEARRQIQDVLTRLSRGIDRLDRELMISCYHPDAIDHHGSYEGSAVGFADWVLERHAGKIEQCMHFLGQINLDIDGDTAVSELHVIVFYRLNKDGVDHDMMAPGRYLDRFERREGEWKIVERVTLHEKDRIDPVVFKMQGPFVDLLPKGRRDKEDPSYAFFNGN
ncbi:nuclear transport factor 2 family protein [Sphingobium sp. JS3065]|uniref:nuclear transport factor 2 family protein n=1 Tax=Sphingobium sp. JS3065 TaxID=2970925 RepID=UPI002264867D|nr:nuclear transport factor 2 family protein [Sphingobium sp. JS3065]UZW55361.1 nuclear transport factor 2 family protein [Sphingobium sp. JS3065]